MTRLTFAAFIFILGIFAFDFTIAYPINKSLQPVDGCVCEKFSCGCCLYMDVPQIWLNDTACINFAYEPDVYGISFVVTIDDKALINETISARNPPPICFPVPYIEDLIDGCIHFTDLDISNSSFHGCVQLELRMWWVYVVAEVSLGCFDTLNHHKALVAGHSLIHKGFERQKVVFSKMAVDDKYKYNVVPIKDTSRNELENVTFTLEVGMEDNQNGTIVSAADKVNSANVVCVNGICSAKNAVCVNGICTVPFNMIADTENNQTNITTPTNQNKQVNSFAKFLHLNKANSIKMSSFLFLLIVMKACMSIINFN